MAQTMTQEILSQVPISQIAARLGTDEASARRATEAALPALLAGLTAQAADPQRAQGLASAVRADHNANLLDDDDPVARVDPAEGDKIVGHVFGDQRGAVEQDLQGFLGGGEGGLVGKLMPMLAPLVMSYMAKKMTGGGAQGGGGGLGDLLGGLLGGAKDDKGGSGATSGGGIGDILGGILGGGKADSASPSTGGNQGGGIGDILGGILGGGGGSEVLDGLRDKDQKGGGLDDILGSILGRR